MSPALLILNRTLERTREDLDSTVIRLQNLESEIYDLKIQKNKHEEVIKDLTEAIENLKLIEDLKKQESEQNVPKRKSKKT